MAAFITNSGSFTQLNSLVSGGTYKASLFLEPYGFGANWI